jgi:hypothetical protein
MLNVAEAAALVPCYRALSTTGGGPGLSTFQRYILAVAMVAGAEAIEWLWWGLLGRPPATYVGLIVAVLASSRFLGTGPGWLTAALATVDLAYDVSNLMVDVEHRERFLGTVAAYVAILLFRRGSFDGLRRLGTGFLRTFGRATPTALWYGVQWNARTITASAASLSRRVVICLLPPPRVVWVGAYVIGLVGVVSRAA